ncbi:MAG: hypothetical protein CHACPFDD_00168 [Phycisphaerae bacterium]|nr:hypothetical protein [Phycisphaerae bacterium]
MAIEFHCPYCSATVRAGDEYAGKRGKCPHCHQSVYIPTPPERIETLDMSPLDARSEQERERLLRETKDLTRKILTDRTAVDSGPPPANSGEGPPPPRADLESLVFQYAESMAAGDLATAEDVAADLRKDLARTDKVVQRILMDEMLPPRLAKIPRPVLVGFFKQLRSG